MRWEYADAADLAIELIVSALIIYLYAVAAAYIWITRRRPVRRDAPTGKDPWTRPGRFLSRYEEPPG